MSDRAHANDKIEFVTPVVVEEALGAEDGKLTGVRVRNLETDEISDIPADGLFVAIGHDPTTKLFVDSCVRRERGRPAYVRGSV